MKAVHNSFDKLNSKVGAKYSTTLPIDKENVQHTHCGTGIKFTLETITEEQIKAMIAKGSSTFIKVEKPVTPPTPTAPASKKNEEKTDKEKS